MNSIPQSSQQLVELLKSRSLHISAAESCTAGLFSSSLASIPGASSMTSRMTKPMKKTTMTILTLILTAD